MGSIRGGEMTVDKADKIEQFIVARTKLGWSQYRTAKELNIGKQRISQWELRQRKPSDYTIDLIIEKLNMIEHSSKHDALDFIKHKSDISELNELKKAIEKRVKAMDKKTKKAVK